MSQNLPAVSDGLSAEKRIAFRNLIGEVYCLAETISGCNPQTDIETYNRTETPDGGEEQVVTVIPLLITECPSTKDARRVLEEVRSKITPRRISVYDFHIDTVSGTVGIALDFFSVQDEPDA